MDNSIIKALEESEKILSLVKSSIDIIILVDIETNYLSVMDILQYISDKAEETRILVTEALLRKYINAE